MTIIVLLLNARLGEDLGLAFFCYEEQIFKLTDLFGRLMRELNCMIWSRMFFSDSKWIQFMLGQVVENSIKYRKPRDMGKENGLVLEIYGTSTQNAVKLHVKDDGIGIRPSEADRVFEKGFTGQNGRIGDNSTGIGLYLCKKLCDRLEHGVELTSVEGEGTEVTFIFPKSSMTKEWVSGDGSQ